MKFFPNALLKRLYNRASLRNTDQGFSFSLKNRLSEAKLTAIHSIRIDKVEYGPEFLSLEFGEPQPRPAHAINPENSVPFPLGKVLKVQVKGGTLAPGTHAIEIQVEASPFGKLKFHLDDILNESEEADNHIPRDDQDDYSDSAIQKRQAFLQEKTGVQLKHLPQFSFDPHSTQGNIEHLTGTAQVPIGIAGPLHIIGDHVEEEVYVPMATTEGTLVASYNRGMKVLNQSGGVRCTVVGDNMQRAPVFVFQDAKEAREFVDWINSNLAEIRKAGESTSSVAKLKHIDYYLASKFAYLRFNYLTGDAAGQNMVGKATFAACNWIIENYQGAEIQNFFLESNLATDKKASMINIMRTRGKRVTAECTIKREVLEAEMRVKPETLQYHYGVAGIGSIISGANNNGLHSANGITAMFIATGQDVANVAESSAGILYSELSPEGDLYMSITLPSLIVATYGGGTGLATQQECLELMGCVGKGKVRRLAEIIAGTVLAGEISLASAISSLDWVSSHEKFGRNR